MGQYLFSGGQPEQGMSQPEPDKLLVKLQDSGLCRGQFPFMGIDAVWGIVGIVMHLLGAKALLPCMNKRYSWSEKNQGSSKGFHAFQSGFVNAGVAHGQMQLVV